MHRYVRWKEVQDRLALWEKEHGQPTRFLHALALLRDEGRAVCCDTIPTVDFSGWDCGDVSVLQSMLDEIPVDVEISPDIITNISSTSVPLKDELNLLPMRIAYPQQVFLHCHDNFEIVYTVRGQCALLTQNETVCCAEGSLCLIAPGLIHEVSAEPDSLVLSFSLWRASIEEILHTLLANECIMAEFFSNCFNSMRPGYAILLLPPNQSTKALIRNIFCEGYSDEAYARNICGEYVGLLFYYALRACAGEPGAFYHREERKNFPIIPVVKYIQDHYRTVTLKELSEVFHYEPDYLSRQIKRHMGKNFLQTVMQIKIEKAKQLLRETNLSIAQISEAAGFHSVFYFSRIFHEKVGISPTDYRRK